MELERLSNGLGHLVGAACGPGRREAITGSISYATDNFASALSGRTFCADCQTRPCAEAAAGQARRHHRRGPGRQCRRPGPGPTAEVGKSLLTALFRLDV